MRTILVVEDDTSMRRLIALGLRRRGWDVLEAEDAQEALELLRGHAVAAVLTDLNLPGWNGLRFLEEARKAGFRHPFIALTADSGRDGELLQRGFTAVWEKPLDEEHLQELEHGL